MGFEAFSSNFTGSSVLHYGAQNMRVKKPVTGAFEGRRKGTGGKPNRACYAWNSEMGCPRNVDECRFEHICSKCGNKAHKRTGCKE